MNREWISKEVLTRKEFRRMTWAGVGREAGISGQTASRVEHDPDRVGWDSWSRLLQWLQKPEARGNSVENLRAFTGFLR